MAAPAFVEDGRRSTVPNLDDLIDKDDPTDLFDLQEELAEGSFGVVYKVR